MQFKDALGLLALSGLLGIAFGLRIYNLGAPTFWLDEAISAFIANKGLVDIIAYTRSQPFEHPPFYYILLSFWATLAGRSELALRFFSLFWGLLFPPLLYRFTRRFFDSQVALWAMVIAAFSPFALAYSREARMYTLVMFLSLLSVYLWLQAVESNRATWWAAYVFANLIGLSTHYYFSLVILAQVLFLAWRWRRFRQAWGRFALCQAFMLVPLLLWLLSSGGPSSTVRQALSYGPIAQRYVEDIFRVTVDLTLGNIVFRPLGLVDYLLPLGPLTVLLVGVFLWSGARIIPFDGSRITTVEVRLFLTLFLIVACLAAFLFPYRFASRYLSIAFVSLCIILALGIIQLQWKGPLTVGLGLLLLGAAFIYGAQGSLAFAKSMYGTMMQEINTKGQPGNGIVLSGPGQWVLFEYYYHGSLPHYYIPVTGPYYYTGDFTRIYLPISKVFASDQEIARTLEAILARHRQVWLVLFEAWNADPENKVERWLNQHAYQAYKKWFGHDIQLAVYFAPGAYESHPGPQVTFEEQLGLREYRVSPGPVAAGDAVRLDLAWQAVRPMDHRYLVSLRLVDAAGHLWAERLSEPQGGYYPTTEWQVGELVADKHALHVPPGTPPGRYLLQLGIYELGQRQGLALFDEKRSPQGVWLNLGFISVIRPPVPPTEESLGIPAGQGLRSRFGDKLLLLGSMEDIDRSEWAVKQGEARTMTLYWRALTEPGGDLALLARLLDNNGQSRWQRAFPLGGPDYPTSSWAEGEIAKVQYDLLIPADLEGGGYRLQVAVQDISTGHVLPAYPAGKRRQGLLTGLFSWPHPTVTEYIDLARVRVEERQRRFAVPSIRHTVEANMAHKVKFLGYDLGATDVRAGDTLHLTLYWQALTKMNESYKVFTHLTDDRGRIWGQHDSIPANWSQPTTGWVKGEIVVDEHEITIKPDAPSGAYILAVGLYDEATGQRLPVYDAQGQLQGDKIVLGSIEIVGSR